MTDDLDDLDGYDIFGDDPFLTFGRRITPEPTKRNNDPHDFAYGCIGDDKDKKLPSCHYTDDRFQHPQTIFGRRNKRTGYDYSDRYPQWDYDKWQEARRIAQESDAVNGSVRYFEIMLTHFHGKKTEIDHVLTGFNLSDGYSYYVFGYWHPKS